MRSASPDPDGSIRRRGRLGSDDSFYRRVFGLVAAAALAYFTVRMLEPFLAPALWAALLAFVLFPLNRRLRARLGGRRGVAATLLTLAVLLGLVVPALAVGYAFLDQAVALGQDLSGAASRYRISGVEDLLRLPVFGRVIGWAEARFGLDPARFQGWIIDALRGVIAWLVGHGRQAVAGVFGLFAGLVLTLFLLFFFFRDGDRTIQRLLPLVPLTPGRLERLTRRLSDVARAVVNGTILTAVAQGTLVAVGFWIVRLPSPIVFGGLTAIASFVPIVGTALVLGPAVIYLAIAGVWWKTIFLLVWGVVVAGSADNVLRPLLISGRAEIGTLAAFIGAVGGLAAFGLVGLFLGPVILSLTIALIDFAVEARAEAAPSPAAPVPAVPEAPVARPDGA